MTCDVAQKVQKQDVSSGALAVNTKRIKDLTQQIQATTDCDALKLIVHTHVDEFQQLAKDALKEQGRQVEKILPIMKLPSPNPFSILKWIGKLVTGTAMPQLEAFIKYATQTVELIGAASQLASVVGQVAPRLQQCAIDTVEEVKQDLTGEVKKAIDKEVDRLVNKIRKNVKDAACEGQAAGPYKDAANILAAVNAVVDAVNITKDLARSVNDLQNTLEASFDNTLSTIDSIQSSITGVTGVQPTIDTSNQQAFTQSINNGAFEQLQQETQKYLDAIPPEIKTAPTIIGSTVVDETVSIDNGEWTGDGPITYKYQWYADDVAIDWATDANFVITLDQLGKILSCGVTAENIAGIVEVRAVINDPVTSIFEPPLSLTLPEISGIAKVGNTLTVSDGTWDGTPPIEYSYQWQYAKTATNIVGATGNTYTIDDEDVGKTLCCVVSATNPLSTVQAISLPTSIVIQ